MSNIATQFAGRPKDRSRSLEAKRETIIRRQIRAEKYGTAR